MKSFGAPGKQTLPSHRAIQHPEMHSHEREQVFCAFAPSLIPILTCVGFAGQDGGSEDVCLLMTAEGSVGLADGLDEGRDDGRSDGLDEGRDDGRSDGLDEGRDDGCVVGLVDGALVGTFVGPDVGLTDGPNDGAAEGYSYEGS